MACRQIAPFEEDFESVTWVEGFYVFEEQGLDQREDMSQWLKIDGAKGYVYVVIHLQLDYIPGFVWEFKFSDAVTAVAFRKRFISK